MQGRGVALSDLWRLSDMIRIRKLSLCVMGFMMAATLAACQDSAEQAETHYQNALAFLAQGDTARASVEFRNVFANDGFHRDARAGFAAMLRDQGDLQQSYSQYLRLVEQYPDDLEGRTALAEMAIEFQNWAEARRHGARVTELAPDAPASRIIALNLAYADAIEAEDPEARRAAADAAREALAETPDNLLLQRLLIDDLIREGDFAGALSQLDSLQQARPGNREILDTRLMLLAQLERAEEVDALLREMIVLFPEDEQLPGMFLRFLLSRGETEEAQNVLRQLAETAATPEQRLGRLGDLIRLRLELEGPEAAIAEIDDILAAGGDGLVTLRTLRASLQFDSGQTTAAIAEVEDLLQREGLSLTERGSLRVLLAQMLLSEGNEAEARRLVDEVLEIDPNQPDALKMLASWLIEEDDADRAIARLRTALDVDPQDAEAMTLMAQAHARNGNAQLSREFLSLAVEASGSAPAESLRYASVLIGEERFLPAEAILIDALRLAPGDLTLLSALGDLYLRMEDWPRAAQVEETLRRQDGPEAIARADELQVRLLQGQGRAEEAMALLEGLAGAGPDGNLQAQIAVVRSRLIAGDSAGALNYAETLLAGDPGNVSLRMVLAATQAASGDLPAATVSYRELLQDAPEIQEAWIGLIRVLGAQGDSAGAATALDEALAVLPDAPDLLWAQASYLQERGDIEGAIALYERLYEMLPNAPVLANNLASLLSTYREDAESLERAHTIARRLRGSDFAPFQDTYGWIAYRRGEYQDALEHLEPAAEGLPDDPLVQFHLGMTYRALGRNDDALAQLTRAVDIVGPDDARPQFGTARAEIAAIEAEMAETSSEGGVVQQ
jgi:tetratricopeptide (TPR) repeat protein